MKRERLHRLALAAAAVSLALAGAAPATPAQEAESRIVAVGDIHGAYESFASILRSAQLTDEQDSWVGNGATLVQTGDFMDRGSDVRKVMDLLMSLQRQAPDRGGRVVVLLGNHEAMNVLGDEQDVASNPSIYASFAGPDSQRRQQAAYKEWTRWVSRQAAARRLPDRGLAECLQGDEALDQCLLNLVEEVKASRRRLPSSLTPEIEQRWAAAHPPGFFEYTEELGRQGTYGRWIRSLPVVVKLDDTIFLHGGLSEEFLKYGLEEINDLHREQLAHLDENRELMARHELVLPWFTWMETRKALGLQLIYPADQRQRQRAQQAWQKLEQIVQTIGSSFSPLWYRGYTGPPKGLRDEELESLVRLTAESYGNRHIVVGHSPLNDASIRSRLAGRVFLIDTGMLSTVYRGRPSALEIHDGRFEAIYQTERIVLLDERPPVARAASQTQARVRRPAVRARLASWATDEGALSWPGRDGKSLPFTTHQEVLDFLRDARVVGRRELKRGKTGAIQLDLERDGVEARAIYHSIHDERGGPGSPVKLADGTSVIYFRDSYKSQIAAYEVGRQLGLDHVPPAVERDLDGVPGSVALWIEGGTDLSTWRETNEGEPKDLRFRRQIHEMRVFDLLINNTDRNAENIFWTPGWDLWLIDHTRAFARSDKVDKAKFLRRCSHRLWRGLRELDQQATSDRLEPYLSARELKALFKRRDKLIKALESLIREKGEDAVLFDLDQADPQST